MQKTDHPDFMIRIGGICGIAGIVIHIVVNKFIKVFPPDNPSSAELATYFEEQVGNWGIVHGFRYVAIVCLVFLIIGLYLRTTSTNVNNNKGWRLCGLVGGFLMLANLLITNGIETFLFYDFSLLSQSVELFQMVFYITRILFTGEIITWAILIGGFSIAGLTVKRLPGYLTYPGILIALCCILSDFFIIQILNESSQVLSIVDSVAAIGGLVWFLAIPIFMIVHGDR